MQPKIANFASRPATAVVVVAIGFVLSSAASYWAANQLERDAKAKFEIAVADAEDGIERRIQAYADVLHGVRGLFSASESVSRDAFHRYVSSLNLEQRYPGIQLVSFSRRVPFERKRDYEAAVRRDTSIDPNGYPHFAIRPLGDRPEYFVAEYVEPMAGNEEAFGLDAGGDAVRAASVERARDSGQLVASGRVTLVRGDTRHVGFTLRLPIYRNGMPQQTVEQRRQDFVGSIVSSYRMNYVMQGVLSEQLLRQFHIRIHDAGFSDSPAPPHHPAAENLLFDNAQLLNTGSGQPDPSLANDENASLSKTLTLDVGGRRWNVYFTARQGFSTAFDRWLPWVVLLGGMSISLLLFGLIRSLATVGSRAMTLAENITEHLRRSEASLAEAQRMTQELIEALPNPVYFKGTDGRYLGVNRAWEKFFGVPRNTFISKTVHDLYPNNPEIADRLFARDLALWEHPGTQIYETSITTPDGQHHDVIYYKATFTHTDGSVAGLIGTIVDITKRKQAETALRDSEARYRSVIAAIAEGVVLRDKNAKIVACNASAERILGLTLDQMRGNVFFDPSWQAIREDGSPFPDEERSIHVALRTGRLQSHVVQGLRKPDGAVLWLSMNVQPLFDESGTTLTGAVSTLTDITERKQADLRQTMEHTVTRILAEAGTLAEAAPRIIQIICETMGWHCGARWQKDEETGVLRCIECWGIDTPAIRGFMAENSKLVVNPGTLSGRGLVRSIYNSGEPVWIADISQEKDLLRAPMVLKAGLHGAFGFPLLVGGEVLGAIEFFHRDVREPDALLLRIAESIGNQIGQFMARKQAEERIRHLASYDELTGLSNRRLFHERLHHALAQAQRHARPLAVLFIDLDEFKNINDTLGHEGGDRALKEVADRLRECLRESDTVGRLGGDEFAVLIEELPQPVDVAAVAQKILDTITRPFILAAREFRISASIGISAYPEDGKETLNLLKNADAAMYRAKERGKNNYQFYSAPTLHR